MYQSHIEVHMNAGILDSSNKLNAGNKMSHTAEIFTDQCIIPDPVQKLIAYSTAGVYIGLLLAWAVDLLPPTQLVVSFIIYTLFAGLLTVRRISIVKKPAKILLLGVAYAIAIALLQSKIF
jgi:hypothetical protein